MKVSNWKFCIYTYPVNSKFTIWQKYKIGTSDVFFPGNDGWHDLEHLSALTTIKYTSAWIVIHIYNIISSLLLSS